MKMTIAGIAGVLLLTFIGIFVTSKDVLPPPFPLCTNCNVILVSLDTLRGDHLNGPALKAIAERSQVFSKAYSPAYFSTPSHMSVFTGLTPRFHRVLGRPLRSRADRYPTTPLSPKTKTLAEILSQHGYRTFWRAPLNSRYLSFKEGFGRGFKDVGPSPFPRGLSADVKNFDASSLNAVFSDSSPAFLFLHSYVAHMPFRFTQSHNSPVSYDESLFEGFLQRLKTHPELLFGQTDWDTLTTQESSEILRKCERQGVHQLSCLEKKIGHDNFWHAVGQWQLVHSSRNIEPTESEHLAVHRKAYATSAQDLDRQIGQLWSELEARNVLDKTIVIFFADHGEQLYEHGQAGHFTFHDHTVRVPLMIYHPKMSGGHTHSHLVSLIDILPTILTLTIQKTTPVTVQGHPLWLSHDLVSGETLGSTYIRDRHFKWLQSGLGEEELYFISADSNEMVNWLQSWNPFARWIRDRLLEKKRIRDLEFTIK